MRMGNWRDFEGRSWKGQLTRKALVLSSHYSSKFNSINNDECEHSVIKMLLTEFNPECWFLSHVEFTQWPHAGAVQEDDPEWAKLATISWGRNQAGLLGQVRFCDHTAWSILATCYMWSHGTAQWVFSSQHDNRSYQEQFIQGDHWLQVSNSHECEKGMLYV